MTFKLSPIAQVKLVNGETVNISLGINIRGYAMFCTTIINRKGISRLGKSFLAHKIDALYYLLDNYPSLKPRQKELQEKIDKVLLGDNQN